MRTEITWMTLSLLALAASTTAAEPPTAARSRAFEIQYQATVDVPNGTGKLDLWIPYPVTDPHQRVSDVRVTAPMRYEVTKDAVLGNSILHLQATDAAGESLAVEVRFKVERDEYVHKAFPKAAASGELPAEAAAWLHPDRLVPLDAKIRELALQVTAGKTTDLEKARAIYDYVVKTMAYDKSGTGWGNGDIYWACDAKRGNCTDFHALFIGLNRAVGIPAKFSIGLPLPEARGTGEIGGYHCWAEFYLRGYGWVPVDASEAKKHPEKEEYFFGAHDENRVRLSSGRDLVLSPKQAGPPLNYFVYPYAEADGKSVPVGKVFHFADLGGATAPGAR